MATNDSGAPALVYGVVHENLIILPESLARDVASDLQAIWSFKTYGEARNFEGKVFDPPGLLDFDDDDEDRPTDDEPYDPTATAEVQSGDWPAGAATMALSYLPDELDDLGEERDGFPQNPFRYIDPVLEDEIVAKCQQAGFVIRRDDDLLRSLP